MKIKKLLAAMTMSALALSMMSMAAGAEDTDPTDPDVPAEVEENVTVLHNGPLNNTELTPLQLGKGIEGAKIRVTYTSASEEGYGVIGIAGKANDDDWTWLQSEDNPAFSSEGAETTSTVEMAYEDFVTFADIGNDVRCYVFMDWGLAENSDCLIELVTPVEHFVEIPVYDGELTSTGVDIVPGELGKNIDGAKIRFTYTSANPAGWGSVGLAGKEKGTWTWKSENKSFASEGENVTSTLVYSYSDFVAAAGVGDNLECFVFQDWGLKADTNFKIDLLIPVEADETSVTVNLYTGDLADNEATFTPIQLGSTVPGAQIKVTYAGSGEEGEAAVGICGNGSEWYVGTNCLASVGEAEPNTWTATYAEFVTFTGITSPVDTYIFQNWGLADDTVCTIDLVLPVPTDETVTEAE